MICEHKKECENRPECIKQVRKEHTKLLVIQGIFIVLIVGIIIEVFLK